MTSALTSNFICSNLFDLTSCLSLPEKGVAFNPSIVHIVEDKYLVCFRFFTRNNSDNSKNHPWYFDQMLSRWSGKDKTYFVIISLDIHYKKFALIKQFGDSFSFLGEDCRLFKMNSGDIICTYNYKVYKNGQINNLKYTIGNGECTKNSPCTAILCRFLNVDLLTLSIQLSPPFHLCSDISNRTEKIGLYGKMIQIYCLHIHLQSSLQQKKIGILTSSTIKYQ